MKRILMVVLVLLGLNPTQAQINICDSVSISGSQYQPTIEVNNINTIMYYWETTGSNGLYTLSEDSMTNQHLVYNYNPTTGLPYDTILTCANTNLTTCCWTFIWDATMWMRMGVQQPYFCCDSITYWTDQAQGLTVGLDTTNMVHNPDSMTVYWGVCTGFAGTGTCYAGNGISDYFPQVTTSDTIKVTYDVYIYENGVAEVCSMEDWLIFDQNTYSWVLLNMGNTTGIVLIPFDEINDGKIYDMLGRELSEVPTGVPYIRNRKIYIKK